MLYFIFLPEIDDFVFYTVRNDRNWIGSGENSDCISSTRLTEMIFFSSYSHGFLLFTLSRDECPRSMCVHRPFPGWVYVWQKDSRYTGDTSIDDWLYYSARYNFVLNHKSLAS